MQKTLGAFQSPFDPVNARALQKDVKLRFLVSASWTELGGSEAAALYLKQFDETGDSPGPGSPACRV